MMKRIIILLGRWVLAGVFIWAALPKIAYPGEFAQAIYYYHLLPAFAVNLTALVLPWLELLCAVALIAAPAWRRAAYVWLCAMLVVFTVAIVINVLRGVDIRCGCFSASGGPMIGWTKVAENGALILMAVFNGVQDGPRPVR